MFLIVFLKGVGGGGGGGGQVLDVDYAVRVGAI